jgi:hypothetical protein
LKNRQPERFEWIDGVILGNLGVQIPAPYVGGGMVTGIFVSLLALGCRQFNFPYLFRWCLEQTLSAEKNEIFKR